MREPPHRRDIPEGDLRDAIEKLRGNALVAALQKLGGELTLDDATNAAARGYRVLMQSNPNGTFTFRLVKK